VRDLGGYFELSGLISGEEFHKNANFRFNTVTNSIIFCIKNRGYNGIYLPYYNCEVVRKKILNAGIPVKYYYIDENFYPIVDNDKIETQFGFLYVDYFGINYLNSKKICDNFDNVIIDNSQAFFSKRISQIDTIYSPRKFFCVTDGAYVYSDIKNSLFDNIKTDKSYHRYTSAFKRLEEDGNGAYDIYKHNEKEIEEQNIITMSKSTQYLLHCIDYKKNSQQNLENFLFLHSKLKYYNKIHIDIDNFTKNEIIPMVYPFVIEKDVRNNLIENKIYVANWWKYLLNEVTINSFEYKLSKYLLPLPIDYRYQMQDMNFIVKNIEKFL